MVGKPPHPNPLLRAAYIGWLAYEHERQHQEIMTLLLQMLPPDRIRRPDGWRPQQAGAEPPDAMVAVPGGPFTLGTTGRLFAYDNEREPHTVESIAARRDCLMMDGRPVFQWAVQLVRDSISSVLAGAQLSPTDVDLVVLHQANMRIIDAAISRLDIPRDKVFVNLDRYGNTSGGSIPLALAEAERAGRIHRGDRIVLCGFGAGLAWGTAVLQY